MSKTYLCASVIKVLIELKDKLNRRKSRNVIFRFSFLKGKVQPAGRFKNLVVWQLRGKAKERGREQCVHTNQQGSFKLKCACKLI